MYLVGSFIFAIICVTDNIYASNEDNFPAWYEKMTDMEHKCPAPVQKESKQVQGGYFQLQSTNQYRANKRCTVVEKNKYTLGVFCANLLTVFVNFLRTTEIQKCYIPHLNTQKFSSLELGHRAWSPYKTAMPF